MLIYRLWMNDYLPVQWCNENESYSVSQQASYHPTEKSEYFSKCRRLKLVYVPTTSTTKMPIEAIVHLPQWLLTSHIWSIAGGPRDVTVTAISIILRRCSDSSHSLELMGAGWLKTSGADAGKKITSYIYRETRLGQNGKHMQHIAYKLFFFLNAN